MVVFPILPDMKNKTCLAAKTCLDDLHEWRSNSQIWVSWGFYHDSTSSFIAAKPCNNVNFQNKHPNIDMESYWLEYPTGSCLILHVSGWYGINPCHIFHHISTTDNLTHYLQGGLVIPGSVINSNSFKMLWVLCSFGCWPKASTQENLEIRRLDEFFHLEISSLLIQNQVSKLLAVGKMRATR